MKIPGHTRLGWRIRDEYLFRKSHKRRGGYYMVKDTISKWDDKKLIKYYNRVYGDS